MRRSGRILTSSLLVLAFTLGVLSPARADGALARLLSPQDAARLATLDARREEALAQARLHPDVQARAAFEAMMAGTAQPIRGRLDAGGDWQCRIGRLDRGGSLTVFPWHPCRVVDDGSGWVLRKLGGSERSQGRLYDADERSLVYLGTVGSPGQALPAFGRLRERDRIARLTQPEAGRLRLEFALSAPDTAYEVMELRRAGAPSVPALGSRHGLTLQWVGWERRGEATVERREDRIFLKGEQRSADGEDYVRVEGEIVDFAGSTFVLRGRVITRVAFDNAGKPCVREGDRTFRAAPGRQYWRMQEARSPCSTLTDYVDLYF